MSRWKGAVSLRNMLLNQWDNEHYIQEWMEKSTRHLEAMSIPPEYMRNAQVRALEGTQVYYVDDAALDVVGVATETWNPEPLMATDLLTPAGFVVLPRPLYAYTGRPLQVDTEDGEVNVVFAPTEWYQARGPYLLSWYPATCKDPEAPINRGTVNAWEMAHTAERPRDGVIITGYLKNDIGIYVVGVCNVVPFGADFWINDRSSVTNFMEPFQVLLRMMQQKVFITDSKAPGNEKKSRRASKLEPINLVTLPRRTTVSRVDNGADENEKAKREYSHRWWCNGFWRNQWYPSSQAHRQKWILGHVRGPKDKPFVPKQRVAHVAEGDGS